MFDQVQEAYKRQQPRDPEKARRILQICSGIAQSLISDFEISEQ